MRTLAFVFAALVASAASAQTPANCAGAGDLRLINGKFATMDAKSSIVSEVTIQNGVFTAVGRGGGRLSPCTKTIDLKGRTLVPRPVDKHQHNLLLWLPPRHD